MRDWCYVVGEFLLLELGSSVAVLRMSLIVDKISWVIWRFWSALESSLNHCSLIRTVARRHRISTFDRRDWSVT